MPGSRLKAAMRRLCPWQEAHHRARFRHRRLPLKPDPSCLRDGSASARCFRMLRVLRCARALRRTVRFSALRPRRALPMLRQLCRHRPLPVRSFPNLPDVWKGRGRGRRLEAVRPVPSLLRQRQVCRKRLPVTRADCSRLALASWTLVLKWRAPGRVQVQVAWRCVRQSGADSRYCRATGSILFSGRCV